MRAIDNSSVCSRIWSAIVAREYRDWQGLPAACRYSDFDAVFARLRDEYGQGGLGRSHLLTLYRMHVAEGYPHHLKVWFRDEAIALIEIRYPALPYPSNELLGQLGDPDARLDYYLDIMPVLKGALVFPTRGITLYLDSGLTEVMWITLYRSCTLAEYLEEIHPDTQMWELPVGE